MPFRTFLVSMESFSSRQQLDCLNGWINSMTELRIGGEPVKVGIIIQCAHCTLTNAHVYTCLYMHLKETSIIS